MTLKEAIDRADALWFDVVRVEPASGATERWHVFWFDSQPAHAFDGDGRPICHDACARKADQLDARTKKGGH